MNIVLHSTILSLCFLSNYPAVINGQTRQGCPSSESISPCSCKISKVDNMPWIICDRLKSITQLKNAVAGMQGFEFNDFIVQNSVLGDLPSDLFRGLQIHSLTFSKTNLTRLTDGVFRPPFLGLENSLQNIEITDAFKDEKMPLTSLSLAHLKKLTIVHLDGNRIPGIGNDWFEAGPSQLRELHLTNSSTAKLGSLAFSTLPNLRKLSVTGGTIDSLSRSMFAKPALNLEAIDFNNNTLTSLPKDFFASMPSIAEVYLEGNAFTEIDENIWAPVWNQLTHVYFTGNPIRCDKDIKWIYKYRLPEVLLGECAEPAILRKRPLKKLTIKDFE